MHSGLIKGDVLISGIVPSQDRDIIKGDTFNLGGGGEVFSKVMDHGPQNQQNSIRVESE